MKLNPIAEVVMWLPGFGPGEDPLALPPQPQATEVRGSDTADSTDQLVASRKPMSIMCTPRAKVAPRETWSRLDSSILDGLKGVAAKIEANMAAIKLLSVLDSEDRAATADERRVLNRFTGWGGAPQAFSGRPEYRAAEAELRSILGEEKFEAARASTPNAHYTSPAVIEAVWDGVKRLGFDGGRILEPSAGNGYFLGAMPTDMAARSTITAIELDPTSARITKELYGQYGVRVLNKGFEEEKLPDGFFDLVISNVPFGAYPVPETRSVPYRNFHIHDYFFAKAMDVVRPGGIVAFITSTGTMDKFDSSVREYLASKAELVGAVRLPSGAFAESANTSVVTDVLFLKRHEDALAVSDDAPLWVGTPEPVPKGPRLRVEGHEWSDMSVNPYILEDEQRFIGRFLRASNGYGFGTSLASPLAAGPELKKRVLSLPEGVYRPKAKVSVDVAAREIFVAAAEWTKPGAYVLTEDGQVAVSEGSVLRVVEETLQKARVTRIKALIPVRDALRRLVAAQAATDDDEKVGVYRTALAASYDKFVRTHGFISTRMNVLAFREDPDFPLLLSLEKWDEESQKADKADIFFRRTVGMVRKAERCEAPEEALLTCLGERGRVVPDRIGELLERNADDAIAELQEMGLVFLDPETSNWVERDAYLSGNVRTKLQVAVSAGDEFAGNADALRGVLPVDLEPKDISARLGSSWVPGEVYVEFMTEVLTIPSPKALYNKLGGAWQVRGGEYGVAVTQTWGTSRVSSISLMEMAMNGAVPSVTDRDLADPDGKKRVVNAVETLAATEKQASIKAAFVEWLWKDEGRAETLARIYNDEYNSLVTRQYNGSHLTLPGFSLAYKLHQHQKDVIWRGIASGMNLLMAHAVGAGKTLSMICTGMEMRRIGMASKPCYVVPNHMLEQFAAEFLRAYPTANVLLASKDDMAPQSRRAMLSRMALGDWDAVVLTHSSFEKIKLPDSFVTPYIKSMIREQEAAIRLEESENNTKLVKQLEKQKKIWVARLAKLTEGNGKDDLLTFDEIGIDSVIVDEAHLFKNLYRFTRLRMPGLPTNDSLRSFDMFMKTRYVMESRGEERGVIFATGTPIANSVAEMWVMKSFLQPRMMRQMGLDNFDAWAANFGEAVTALELAPDGSSYRMHTRFARFVNVPELMAIFREVADIRTKEMMNLPTPTMIRKIIAAKPGATLKAYVETLVARAEKIRNGVVNPKDDNMLKVTTDGRKAATDLRLCGIDVDDPGSKVNLCVENVVEIRNRTTDFKGTQLVFLDMGTPSTSWSLYADMRHKMIEQGIPPEEIAFIHDAASDAAKEKLFKATREGKIRVVFGSTSKMGVGTNVQTRLKALHHVDGPWRPADVEQRDGRIERQGNLNEVAEIYRYVTEATFDAYTWQTLETKARFIAQVMSGDVSVRSLEDAELSALSYAEVKALASGNPLVIEKAGVDADVMRLSMLESKWRQQSWSNRHAIADLPKRIAKRKAVLASAMADAGLAADTSGKNFRIELDGKTYTDREEAGKRLLGRLSVLKEKDRVEVGRIGDFTIEAAGAGAFRDPELHLVGSLVYSISLGQGSAVGLVRRLENAMSEPLEVAEESNKMIARMERELEGFKQVVDAPFEHAERLAQLLARKEEIDRDLGVHEGDKSVVVDVDMAKAA